MVEYTCFIFVISVIIRENRMTQRPSDRVPTCYGNDGGGRRRVFGTHIGL